jgi:hypothetical protein
MDVTWQRWTEQNGSMLLGPDGVCGCQSGIEQSLDKALVLLIGLVLDLANISRFDEMMLMVLA